MSRVKLTEYRAKKLLLGDQYQGVALGEREDVPDGLWVVKVDQGIKKRMKQGLVKVKVSPGDIPGVLAPWRDKGFTNFIAEPFLPHEAADEQYLSLERVREGIRLLHAKEGGIEIEVHPEKVTSLIVTDSVSEAVEKTGLPKAFLEKLLTVFEEQYFAFLEINPLVLIDGVPHLLDAAVLADSAGQFFVRGSWGEDDIAEGKAKHPAEERIQALQKTTPASLKLTVLNPNGSLFFLLSGGGGSIVIADEAALLNVGGEIGNYGEYSGGPTREETYLYAKEILTLLLASRSKQKALVIAGGVANFTDVAKTFAGIIDALAEVAPQLREAGVKVYVRRGGPNEREGLSKMEAFLKKEGLLGAIYGSDAVITAAVDDAIKAIV